MLETLREYAAQSLRGNAQHRGGREGHHEYFIRVAEHADTMFRSWQQLTGAASFEREWNNLRTAHEWAIATRNRAASQRLLAASYLFALSQLRFEHGDWAEAAIALDTEES